MRKYQWLALRNQKRLYVRSNRLIQFMDWCDVCLFIFGLYRGTLKTSRIHMIFWIILITVIIRFILILVAAVRYFFPPIKNTNVYAFRSHTDDMCVTHSAHHADRAENELNKMCVYVIFNIKLCN